MGKMISDGKGMGCWVDPQGFWIMDFRDIALGKMSGIIGMVRGQN